MAASMSIVRVKLSFDNLINQEGVVPPKAWYLVDFKCLDTIADLERDVIAKYSLEWLKSIDFYVEGCLLPKWESIRLIHENDVLKLEASGQKVKKRKQSSEKIGPSKRSRVDTVKVAAGGDSKQAQTSSSSSSDSDSDDAANKSKKTSKTVQSSSSDSDSDDKQQADNSKIQNTPEINDTFTEETLQTGQGEQSKTRSRTRRRKRRQKKGNGNTTMEDKSSVAKSNNGFVTPNAWPLSNGQYNSPGVAQTKQHSGHIKFEEEEEENEDCRVVIPEISTESPMATESVEPAVDLPSNHEVSEQEQPADDSWKQAMLAMAENSTTFKPRQLRNSLVAGAKVYNRENRYKAKKDPNFSFSKAEQLSTVATNKSFFFKNPAQNDHSTKNSSEQSPQSKPNRKSQSTPATPKSNATDYSSYPPLHNMPNVGQTIAYKIVEMSENYCPLVSEYKEAKVLEVHHGLKQLTLEILKGGKKARDQPGKFDIPDQTDMEEDKRVSVTWTSLIDVKLTAE